MDHLQLPVDVAGHAVALLLGVEVDPHLVLLPRQQLEVLLTDGERRLHLQDEVGGQLASRDDVQELADLHQRLVLLPGVLEGQLGLGELEARVDEVALYGGGAEGLGLPVLPDLDVQVKELLDHPLLLGVGSELEHVPVLRREGDLVGEDTEHAVVFDLLFLLLLLVFILIFFVALFRAALLFLDGLLLVLLADPDEGLRLPALVLDEDLLGRLPVGVLGVEVEVLEVVFAEDGGPYSFGLELDVDVHALFDHEVEGVLELGGVVRGADDVDVHAGVGLEHSVLL